MLELLFGWRKASKCKKLIRKVQCRLKLLKNKRCCIVKQSRSDVAQLLKSGHHQPAFHRVEQIFEDENMVELYDLLENYCEFVIINLPYIRKHKDCPNDINEAVSTLIFSSARFGELPELLSIRKLFGERYGQRFITTALELQPGNLVNLQIKETLYVKDVPDDVKYKLLNELVTSYVEPGGPLLLEYKPMFQQQQSQISSKNVPKKDQSDATEVQGKIVYVDSASESKKISKEQNLSIVKSADGGEVFKFPIYGNEPLKLLRHSISMAEDSGSETLTQLPEEMIYLDDIQEFVPPVTMDGNLQDQRLFVFKSFGTGNYDNLDEQVLSQNQKLVSRNSLKITKPSRKRLRRRSSVSHDNLLDVESTIYYGELDEASPDSQDKFKHERRRRTTSWVDKSRNLTGNIVQKQRSLESLCRITKTDSSKTKDLTMQIQYCHDEPTENKGTGEDETRISYSRALTMPTERANESPADSIFRSKSFPLEQPCHHIHPKLPDYDELAAKFMALKRDNMLNKQARNR